MRDKTVAVSGLGSIGLQHAEALRSIDGVRVIGFDPSEELRVRAADRGVAPAVGDFEALLDLGPDALVVAAPDQFHLPQLERAAERGITVLVEKPLAPSAAEAAAVVERVERGGTRALVGYVLRHRRIVGEVRDLLQGGAIGTPVSFQVMLGAYGTILAAVSRFSKPEEGRLYRDYSHEWDYLRWFFGPIARCVATARTVRDVGHVEGPNAVDALLVHESGIAGAVHLDYAEPVGLRTLHVVGTGGSLFADLGRGDLTVRTVEGGVVQTSHAEPPAAGLRRQAEHLLDVAAGVAAPVVTLRDGLAAIAIADALRESAASGSWTTPSA